MGEHLFTDVVLSYITLILGVGVFQKQSYACTLGNFYLAGHLMETVYTRDWFHCFLVCHNEPKCVSYNFNKQYGICDLNDHGIEDSDNVHIKLTRKPGTFFHQIRALHKFINGMVPCACSYLELLNYSTKPVSTLQPPFPGNTAENAATSCKMISQQSSRSAGNGAYYIKAMNTDQYTHVYCHMNTITECGEHGGWTLVMKIDGNKLTFTYESKFWTNMLSYNEGSGVNMEDDETKMPTFWSTPLQEICLGMKSNEVTRWLLVRQSGLSLHALLSSGSFTTINITVQAWEELVGNGSLQINSTKSGFNTEVTNSRSSAKARIGIIGFESSAQLASSSRIGFGTGGSIYGMDSENSCGNDARNNPDNGDIAKKVFGYILVR